MPQNTTEIILKRREIIAGLYLKGVPQYVIAEEVQSRMDISCSRQQVTADIHVLIEEWRESAKRDIETAKMQELAKIDSLEREYWEAWEKSKTDYKQRYVKRKGVNMTDDERERFIADEEERGQKEMIIFGDPRFLQGVQWCINKRCEIFGVNAPIEITSTIKGGFPDYTDDELRDSVTTFLEQKRKK